MNNTDLRTHLNRLSVCGGVNETRQGPPKPDGLLSNFYLTLQTGASRLFTADLFNLSFNFGEALPWAIVST